MSDSSAEQARQATVPDTAAGRRFDAVLAELFPEYSRSKLTEWIKSGDVLLDGVTVRGRDPVRGGEVATLNAVLETQTHAEPEDIPLDVLFEDEHLLVINKPVGLVVHPGAGNSSGTLVNALLYRDASVSALPRAGIVHRLDKDTSGVMVIARTIQAQTALVEQLSERQVHRQYLAVVVGALVAGGTADAPIDRHPRDRLKMGVREDGKEAITHYRLRERFRAHTALECRLETGRTHQIRVHMAHIGHPLIGDPEYGSAFRTKANLLPDDAKAVVNRFPRQALHAFLLSFEHPRTGDVMDFETPMPDDMEELAAALRA